ncbi:conjugal transfer protein TraD [Simkania negevensis]|uniref:Conjugal transfer protein TraD n=1 Tax=Simkania negevensis (strain ATCC VR-1471 / DSM 27360 / Z) TaxID=331113 RepID=F8L2U0_SIMNZ|nr:conjugal transfer protein TraD [Simkania negevensis]CCB87786.1 conjugal transfer protein TraD [Simkania negevensis Z]
MELDFEDEKMKLALKKSRIEAQEKRLKEKERKIRTRRLIELGGLVSKAGVEELNNNALLGALLDIKEKLNEESTVKKWKDKGAAAFEKDKAQNGEALIVSFDAEPPREAKDKLRNLGLRWNRFRREWQGYGKKDLLEKELREFGAMIESVE